MFKVQIIESEQGWGQKVDETKEFKSLKEATDFVEKFNSYNSLDEVPTWYMYAVLVIH